MSDTTRIIEIEGVKLEVDLRAAKRVDTFKVGNRVKVLTKNYSGYESHAGVIVGIDAYKSLPTVVIAYIDNPLSSSCELKFAYLNSQSKDLEICPMAEHDEVMTHQTVVKHFEAAIAKKRREMEDIEIKRDYFLRQYGVAFGVGAEEVAAATA
jgi:hypothetical protein